MNLPYPLNPVTDDSGALVTGATVTVASVTDIDGTPIASPGAVVHLAGSNVTVMYDAEAKGEAWITLAVSKAAHTFTGLNASPVLYASKDPSRIESVLPATGPIPANVTEWAGQTVIATPTGAVNDSAATTTSFITNLTYTVTS